MSATTATWRRHGWVVRGAGMSGGMAAELVLELGPHEGPAAPDSLQFIGTATVLIRYGGITVLTDPN